MDFNESSYFINRELSWLGFNERVLEEAWDKTNPLLERFKFLAITGSNMDEFFMVRVSGIMSQIDSGYKNRDISGLTPKEQLAKISERVHAIVARQNNCLSRSLLPSLEKEGVFFLGMAELNGEQKKFIREYYDSTIFPILTPMAIDQSRPFPLLPNKSLSIIAKLKSAEDNEKRYAVLQAPTVIPRIVALPSEAGRHDYIMLEDIVAEYIPTLFYGYTVEKKSFFRLTRDSDLEIDEEDTSDLLVEIEKSIKRRKWGEPVRLEIDKGMDGELRKYLEKSLNLNDDDIYEFSSYLDVTVWMKFYGMPDRDDLRDAPAIPQAVTEFIDRDMFEVIKNQDVLVHHPYQSFDCVVRFVKKAASDPAVLAIKQTLYRVSGNSPIVASLIQAAENGKQVTVLVELKARFDEENNINWARKLEKAGCHVIYGLVGLKTHCKCCLIVRNEEDGIKRYVHLGTGNYNDSTAKLYTDMGLFTSRKSFGADVSALFNVLTGYSLPPKWKSISVAPTSMRQTFMHWIENETEAAKRGERAEITAKMNSLVDPDIIKALYKASAAGVKINLIVRGICCLKTGIQGVSENIRVISIVGRFLEHSRIYYFYDGGGEKIFLSSADWMPRNLDKRVETLFPIENEALKDRIKQILATTLADTVKARIMLPDGSYEHIDRRGKEALASQAYFTEQALQEYKRAVKDIKKELFKPIEAAPKTDDDEGE